MKSKSSRRIRHEICRQELIEFGGQVMDVSDKMTYVAFNLGETTVAYIYSVTPEDDFHFERAKPYVMDIGSYQTENEIVDIIKNDIKQFKNAMKSSHFGQFIEVDRHIAETVRTFEDLYLYYNIEDDALAIISNEVQRLKEQIFAIKNASERVYFESEPQSFKQ